VGGAGAGEVVFGAHCQIIASLSVSENTDCLIVSMCMQNLPSTSSIFMPGIRAFSDGTWPSRTESAFIATIFFFSLFHFSFNFLPSLGQVAGIPGVNSNPGEPGAVRRGAIARLIDVKFFVYRVQFHFSEFCANSLCSSITFGNAI
jgi:hypothetical protein